MTATGAESLFEFAPADQRNAVFRARDYAQKFLDANLWEISNDISLTSGLDSYSDGYVRLGIQLANLLQIPEFHGAILDPFELSETASRTSWCIDWGLAQSMGELLGSISAGLQVKHLLKPPSTLIQEWADKFDELQETVRKLLVEGATDTTRLTSVYNLAQSYWTSLSLLNQSAVSFETKQVIADLSSIVQETNRFAQEARQSAISAQTAAGLASDAGLAKHFAGLGAAELKAANKFRWSAIGAMILGGLVAAVFVLMSIMGLEKFDIESTDYTHLAQRAVLVAGLFTFSAYLSRQAYNHRTLATWASTLAVQLKTFDGYADAVKYPEVSSILRKNFAARVFGEQPGLKGEASSDGGEALVQKAAELISKILPGDKS